MPGELIERMRNAGQREGYVNLSEIARHAIREWVTSVEASRKLAATS
jgi:Arc/MetJ-type ribon-helix-helix transcriptional regulator